MKHLIIFLFICLLFSCSQGQNKYLPEKEVQKIFEAKYDSLRSNLKDSLTKGIGSVNDFGNAYKIEEVKHLDSLIADFKEKSGIQLVIFTFDSLMTSTDSVDAVTQIIAFKNKINTTVGLSFSHRKISIWTDSLVNNTIFTQREAQYMIDNKFVPFFTEKELFKGTVSGLKAMMQRMINNRRDYESLKKDGG